jgi:hypothetical protein
MTAALSEIKLCRHWIEIAGGWKLPASDNANAHGPQPCTAAPKLGTGQGPENNSNDLDLTIESSTVKQKPLPIIKQRRDVFDERKPARSRSGGTSRISHTSRPVSRRPQ